MVVVILGLVVLLPSLAVPGLCCFVRVTHRHNRAWAADGPAWLLEACLKVCEGYYMVVCNYIVVVVVPERREAVDRLS